MPNELGRPRGNRLASTAGVARAAATYALSRASRSAYDTVFNPRVSMPTKMAIVRATHEPKYHDTTLTTAAISNNAGSLYPVNLTIQGTGGDSRVGREFINESLHLRFNVYSAAVSDIDYLRVMVVWDKEVRGTIWAAGDLFGHVGATLTAVSPINADNFYRFKVLSDRYFTAKSPFAANGASYAVDYSVRLSNLRTRCFNSSNGTIADIDSGSLVVYLVTGNEQVSIVGFSQLKFRDL